MSVEEYLKSIEDLDALEGFKNLRRMAENQKYFTDCQLHGTLFADVQQRNRIAAWKESHR